MRRSVPLLAMLLAAWIAPGCSDDECTSDQDCPGDRICRANTCVAPKTGEGEGEGEGSSCQHDTDCDPPLVCDRATRRCRQPQQYDLGPEDSGGGGGEPDAGGGEDAGEDRTPPQVVSTDPPDGTRNVPVDKRVKVVFSEPVKERIVEAAITLYDTMDPSDPLDGVGWPVVWDEATLTATVTPPAGQKLEPYTTYKLVVREEIKDLAGNNLLEWRDIFFTTAPDAAAEAHYEAIARRFAPDIFQEVHHEQPKADWIAAYDFNDEWKGTRKYQAWQRQDADLRGTLYWSVVETKTHFFITYAYYHPFDYDRSGVTNPRRENSIHGAQVVVAKRGADLEWLALETYVGAGFWAYTVDGARIQPRPAAQGGIGQFKKTMPAEWLLDNARYQAFIPYGTHEACVWGHETSVLDMRCPQLDAASFYQNRGVRYIPGDGADGEQPPAQAAPCAGGCGPGESCSNGECVGVRYGFRSLAGELWTRIHEHPSQGEEIWAPPPFTYTPLPEQSRRPGAGMVLPRALTGNIDGSLGQPPWAWKDEADSEVGQGQWFIDPAFVFGRHMAPTGEDPWSVEKQDYCWNVYLGVYNWQAPGCSGQQ